VQKIFAKSLLGLVLVAAVGIGGSVPAQAAGSTSAKGKHGQTLTASITKGTLPVGETTNVTVSGKGYNTKTGIYATFCVMPEPGKKPETCGSYNITGINSQAVWISSNPPFYASLLVKKFGKGGTFKVTLPITSTIGEIDCTKVKCAIVTRADHTNPENRKADVIIPLTFK
jgi:hypothetical protein